MMDLQLKVSIKQRQLLWLTHLGLRMNETTRLNSAYQHHTGRVGFKYHKNIAIVINPIHMGLVLPGDLID